MIKILNLYSGIGGNRKLWPNKDIIVTAIENNKEISKIYQDFFPNDKVIITDAHKYLLNHYKEFDFIWASPPCPSHSRLRKANEKQNKPKYIDLRLYQEIIFLSSFFKGKWLIENVITYYNPLIPPIIEMGNHYFWSNFNITKYDYFNNKGMGNNESINQLEKIKGFDLSKYNNIDKIRVLRNCVDSQIGNFIFKMAFKSDQKTLI